MDQLTKNFESVRAKGDKEHKLYNAYQPYVWYRYPAHEDEEPWDTYHKLRWTESVKNAIPQCQPNKEVSDWLKTSVSMDPVNRVWVDEMAKVGSRAHYMRVYYSTGEMPTVWSVNGVTEFSFAEKKTPDYQSETPNRLMKSTGALCAIVKYFTLSEVRAFRRVNKRFALEIVPNSLAQMKNEAKEANLAHFAELSAEKYGMSRDFVQEPYTDQNLEKVFLNPVMFRELKDIQKKLEWAVRVLGNDAKIKNENANDKEEAKDNDPSGE